MKELKIIQTFAKIGKVLSKIMFACSIVSLCMCIAGILCVAIGFGVIEIGEITLKTIIGDAFEVETGTLYAYLAAGIVICLGEAILAKFATHYFVRELADGTPFTIGGAKDLLRLGILKICIPLGTYILAKIVYAIVSSFTNNINSFDMSNDISISLGVMFIVISVICKYGAVLNDKENL